MAAARLNRVAVIGSGNFGSVAAKIVALNAGRLTNFHPTVRMSVHEELVQGQKLTEIINTRHENVKYLPGCRLPDNVVADPDLKSTVKDANLLVFVCPHQFLEASLAKIKGHVTPGTVAISLIKGVLTKNEEMILISQVIRRELGIDCCVMGGANIANEMAEEQFCETTIGYSAGSEITAGVWKDLFQTEYFRVALVADPIGVELCGALKNVVALAAGFCDGMGAGNNTKAAIIRIGLNEMRMFTKRLFNGGDDLTYYESCGVADLITTCYGGRNRKAAELFVKTGKSFEQIEQETLDGQKLQGTGTSVDVIKMLRNRRLEHEFPLFSAVYRIAYEGFPVREMFHALIGMRARL